MQVFSDTTVRCYYKYMDRTYHYFIHVYSDNPLFSNWEQEFLTTGMPPTGSELEFCMMVHHKVFKHIRKRLKKSTTRLLRKTKYRKLFDAQEGMCYLCNEPLSIFDCTVDHVVPKSRGGKDSIRNLLLAHSMCNTEKANRVPTKQELKYLKDVIEKAKFIHYVSIK